MNTSFGIYESNSYRSPQFVYIQVICDPKLPFLTFKSCRSDGNEVARPRNGPRETSSFRVDKLSLRAAQTGKGNSVWLWSLDPVNERKRLLGTQIAPLFFILKTLSKVRRSRKWTNTCCNEVVINRFELLNKKNRTLSLDMAKVLVGESKFSLLRSAQLQMVFYRSRSCPIFILLYILTFR